MYDLVHINYCVYTHPACTPPHSHALTHTHTHTHTELEEARTQLTLGQSDSQSKRKEVLKLERTNRKLREELAALQEHVATYLVSRSELEAYKKAIEEKVNGYTCMCMHVHV